MRNLLKNQKVLASIICLLFFSSVHSQHYLPVPLKGQESSLWCWASSMNMIFDFHAHPAVIPAQCDLAMEYERYKYKKTNLTALSGTFFNGCCSTPCYDEGATASFVWPPVTDNCYKSIEYSKRAGNVTLQYFDLLFSHYDYTSAEDIVTPWMNWTNIKREIDACRPFIVLLNKVNTALAYNHAVVAKGYEELDASQYILVNDPEPDSCRGCEYLLPISIFSAPTTQLNSALEVVRNIHPKDSSVCAPCDKRKSTEDHALIAAIKNNNGDPRFFNVGRPEISNDRIQTILKGMQLGEDDYYGSIYTYTDLRVEKQVLGLTAAKTEPPLSVFLEQSEENGSWTIQGITFGSCTPLTSQLLISSPINNVPILLENGQFDIIEYVPDNFQFYRLEFRGQKYWTPVRNYPGLEFKKGVLYKEKEVTKFLQAGADQREGEVVNPDLNKKKPFFLCRIFKKKNS